ncbi:hypothetical protein DJ030_04660 [bacterium endosymbiont of Escarpia laminata]|nr:MAG: hypothetical protein DJ030_04660 [bacterium endosymbiont of Escarpia laminata]
MESTGSFALKRIDLTLVYLFMPTLIKKWSKIDVTVIQSLGGLISPPSVRIVVVVLTIDTQPNTKQQQALQLLNSIHVQTGSLTQ